MVQRLLLDGVNGQRTRFTIHLAHKYTSLISSAMANTRLALGNMAMVRTKRTLHPSIIHPLKILTLRHLLLRQQILHYSLFTIHLEYYCFVNVKFCVAPAVPAQSSLVLRTMSHEFFFGPVYLVGHLWQERAAAVTLLDIDSMTM